MQRIDILQELINKNNYKRYVEIGTYKGTTILTLKCETKIAVDPKIKISWKRKLKWILKNPTNLRNSYFQMTSDEFFRNEFKKIENGIDLFFIDGLHTFEASLKDVLNSLKFLNAGGTILMHDCFPPHRAAAIPASSYGRAKAKEPEGWNGQWCGDVWKTILYLKRALDSELNVSVWNTDFGLGVITLNKTLVSYCIDKRLFDEINELDYSYLMNNTKELGLKESPL